MMLNDCLLYTSIQKQRTKLSRKNASGSLRFPSFNASDLIEEEEEKQKIVKTKSFNVKPMSEDEAILQMELLGHNFFVYEDADTSKVNVIYKRKDGNYGLIEPEYK